jgi:5-methylcytosine-specific restriction protein A
MRRLCKYCGTIHDGECDRKPKYTSRKYERDPQIYHFRNSGKWKRKRAEIMERDYHLCRVCASKHSLVTAVEVHHIIPLADNYDLRLDNSNLVALCQTCHQLAEAGVIPADSLRNIITASIESEV